MADPSDDELDRLLSRGRLGQARKRRMLRDVLASVQASEVPARRFRWRWPSLAVLSLSGGLAAAAFWARPFAEAPSALREKGPPAGAPVIAMACLGGSLGACPPGSRIAFWLEGDRKEPAFVTAYADPVGGGERVWYLTNEAVPRAALVGKEQSSGRYRVSAILTRRPVERTRLTPDTIVAHAVFDLVISP